MRLSDSGSSCLQISYSWSSSAPSWYLLSIDLPASCWCSTWWSNPHCWSLSVSDFWGSTSWCLSRSNSNLQNSLLSSYSSWSFGCYFCLLGLDAKSSQSCYWEEYLLWRSSIEQNLFLKNVFAQFQEFSASFVSTGPIMQPLLAHMPSVENQEWNWSCWPAFWSISLCWASVYCSHLASHCYLHSPKTLLSWAFHTSHIGLVSAASTVMTRIPNRFASRSCVWPCRLLVFLPGMASTAQRWGDDTGHLSCLAAEV